MLSALSFSLVSMAASTRQRLSLPMVEGAHRVLRPCAVQPHVWFHMGPRCGKSVRSLGERP